MKVRLGFAVAAHLEPEILIIDEVLAVGDIEFQKRCLGKMREVATSGRTVLFVSHKMGSVEQLCDRAILLDQGQVADDGDPARVVHEYARKQSAKRSGGDAPVNKFPASDIQLVEADLLNADGEPAEVIKFGEPFGVRLVWANQRDRPGLNYNIQVLSDLDDLLFASNSMLDESKGWGERGHKTIECHVAQNVLPPGSYRLDVNAFIRGFGHLQTVESCIDLLISESPWDETRPWVTTNAAKFVPHCQWEERTSSVSIASTNSA
jgi:lipopolysaccharide transport system ATP-binding protein